MCRSRHDDRRGRNDTYVVDRAGDHVSEEDGSGTDTVLNSRSVDLTSAQFSGAVENVTLTGTADLDVTGNGLANTIRGNAGDNQIDCGFGSDRMSGFRGDDTYVVNSGGGVVDEGIAGSVGTDLVISAVTFNLRGAQVAGTQTAVEDLVLSGNATINGFVNALENRIVGNAAASILSGSPAMTFCPTGADIFVFQSALSANSNVDAILNFDVAQDTMHLKSLFRTALGAGTLDPRGFHIGSAAADAERHIIYNAANGNLSHDADDVGGAAAIRFAVLDPGLALSSADFLVI